MKRIAVLAENPRKTLAALAALLIAVSVAVGSGATFTSTSANAANTYTAGTLKHTNSKDAAAILVADKLKPGQSANGTVTITNTGDVAGAFTLAQDQLVDTPGANGGKVSTQFDLLVQDVTVAAAPVQVYAGKVSGMSSQALGSFAAGEARTYKFTVTFPDGGTPASATTGDNAFKGSSVSVRYTWNATS